MNAGAFNTIPATEWQPEPDAPASKLITALSGTFEPGNVDWVKTKSCPRCGAPTLRRPVFDTSGRIMVMGCVLCQYQSFEQVLIRQAKPVPATF